jgi:hypothetical protein
MAQADGVVDVREWKKFDTKLGKGRSWTQLAIGLTKNFLELWDHLLRI